MKKEEELEKIDSFIMEYEEKVVDLNKEETFQSAMSCEEDQKFILNTEKKLALKEGERKATIQFAKKLLNKGVDIQLISECCELSEEEIRNV